MVTAQARRGDTRQRGESGDRYITQAQLGGRGREKAPGEAGRQAGHAGLHGDRSAAQPAGSNCAKCGQSATGTCPGGLRAPGLSPAGAGAGGGGRAGAPGRAPGRVLPALRRCPVITASPVSGCSQVVLFASSLRGRTHGPSQAGAAPPPPALPPSHSLSFPSPHAPPGPAPLPSWPAPRSLDEEDAAALADPVTPAAGQRPQPLGAQLRHGRAAAAGESRAQPRGARAGGRRGHERRARPRRRQHLGEGRGGEGRAQRPPRPAPPRGRAGRGGAPGRRGRVPAGGDGGSAARRPGPSRGDGGGIRCAAAVPGAGRHGRSEAAAPDPSAAPRSLPGL